MSPADLSACTAIKGFAAIDPAATAQTTAAVFDEELETMATVANDLANQTRDERWRNAALAFLGARRMMRGLMTNADREGLA